MLVLRLVGLLVLVSIAGSLAIYFFTRDRRYLTFAWRILQFAFVFLVLFAVFYLLERLVLVI
ncbi:MAG: hypothetical protein FJY54_00610 [Betaproteobacteria bacterium]|nr:hypothetical protein [Betaproteobacteria bacterium]